MDFLSLIFSTRGRLRPQPFSIAVILVYLAGFASQALLTAPIIARSGIAPFALAQAALTWAWFVIHAKRLRDANRGIGGAVAIALLYALAIVLLMMIVAFFLDIIAREARSAEDADRATMIMLLLVIYIFDFLFHAPDFGFFNVLIMVLGLIALTPALIAFVFSIYVGTRRSVPPPIAMPPPAPA